VKNAGAALPATATLPADTNAVATALANKYSSGALNPSVSRRLNNMVGVTGFGKKRRSHKKRHSFGKKRRSSHKKRSASFGKKRRSSHKKRASFGKKRRSHKKRA
jgi:hypothetical protein